MALIKCPECGKEISDRAQACIHCGCPIAADNIQGQVMIKVSKHPRESQVVSHVLFTPVYGTAADIYLFKTDGSLLASMKSGSVISIDVLEPISFYASFYKDDKNSSLNNKTKSEVVTVHPNIITKLQIGFAQSAWTTKIIISHVDYIDAE